MHHFIDILNEQPRLMMNEARVRQALMNAFYTGRADALLSHSLQSEPRTSQAQNGWDPTLYADQLFLDTLIERFFKVEVDGEQLEVNQGTIRHLITTPAMDPATIRFRQEYLRELLAFPEQHNKAKRLLKSLSWLVHLINSSLQGERYAFYSDLAHWRMVVLRCLKRIIDQLAADFGGCTSQAGRRLHEYGQQLSLHDDFGQLAGLVDYDRNMLSMNLRVQIGADGHIADFQLAGVAENLGNVHHRGPWHRFFTKTMLWIRGCPFSNLQLVNNIIEKVYLLYEPVIVSFLQLHGQLSFYMASIGMRAEMARHGLKMCLPEFSVPKSDGAREMQLHGLFNPLLFCQEVRPVPCSVGGRHGGINLITGPNSGGKTRMLQALGLAQILGQSGLFVPASQGHMHIHNGIFLSLIEEGGVDQAEGRLGSELQRIRNLFSQCPDRSLILLDELCSGTNPSEGIEILEVVLQILPKLQPNAFITTHFLDFAQRLADEKRPGLDFIQVALTSDNRPTFGFAPGVAQTSLARQTAERLGVTWDQLMQLVDARTAASPSRCAWLPRAS